MMSAVIFPVDSISFRALRDRQIRIYRSKIAAIERHAKECHAESAYISRRRRPAAVSRGAEARCLRLYCHAMLAIHGHGQR